LPTARCVQTDRTAEGAIYEYQKKRDRKDKTEDRKTEGENRTQSKTSSQQKGDRTESEANRPSKSKAEGEIVHVQCQARFLAAHKKNQKKYDFT